MRLCIVFLLALLFTASTGNAHAQVYSNPFDVSGDLNGFYTQGPNAIVPASSGSGNGVLEFSTTALVSSTGISVEPGGYYTLSVNVRAIDVEPDDYVILSAMTRGDADGDGLNGGNLTVAKDTLVAGTSPWVRATLNAEIPMHNNLLGVELSLVSTSGNAVAQFDSLVVHDLSLAGDGGMDPFTSSASCNAPFTGDCPDAPWTTEQYYAYASSGAVLEVVDLYSSSSESGVRMEITGDLPSAAERVTIATPSLLASQEKVYRAAVDVRVSSAAEAALSGGQVDFKVEVLARPGNRVVANATLPNDAEAGWHRLALDGLLLQGSEDRFGVSVAVSAPASTDCTASSCGPFDVASIQLAESGPDDYFGPACPAGTYMSERAGHCKNLHTSYGADLTLLPGPLATRKHLTASDLSTGAADAINSEITNHTGSDGLILRLPSGTYDLDKPIVMSSDLILEGSGVGRTTLNYIDSPQTCQDGIYVVPDAVNIDTLVSTLTWTPICSKNVQNAAVRDMSITGGNKINQRVSFSKSEQLAIERLEIPEGIGAGIYVQYSQHVTVRDITVGGLDYQSAWVGHCHSMRSYCDSGMAPHGLSRSEDVLIASITSWERSYAYSTATELEYVGNYMHDCTDTACWGPNFPGIADAWIHDNRFAVWLKPPNPGNVWGVRVAQGYGRDAERIRIYDNAFSYRGDLADSGGTMVVVGSGDTLPDGVYYSVKDVLVRDNVYPSNARGHREKYYSTADTTYLFRNSPSDAYVPYVGAWNTDVTICSGSEEDSIAGENNYTSQCGSPLTDGCISWRLQFTTAPASIQEETCTVAAKDWVFSSAPQLQIVGAPQEEQSETRGLEVSAYPNPFNPTSTFEVSVPVQSDVSLTVYDITGRRVATLMKGAYAAGRHQAVFNAGSLASGVYFYRIVAGTTVQDGRLHLIK